MTGLRRKWGLALAVGATLTLVGTALAVQTPIEGVVLEGPDNATFTYGDGDRVCSAGTSSTSGGRQPFSVQDASNDVGGDAFDGAMGLHKADNPFIDSDGIGERNAQQLRVGPEQLGRLKVRQTHRALPTSQTLRALVKLKNPTNRELTPRVTFSHQYGSDSNTAVRATSTGNLRFDRHDRWAVTSDDADSAELGDPVVTTVNYGKGDVERTKLQLGPASTDAAEDKDAADCAVMSFDLRLPAGSSRYLLFFLELGETNEGAIADASRYNDRKLDPALKNGLSGAVKRKVLNWDFAQRKGKR
jgi:hypothetical protein